MLERRGSRVRSQVVRALRGEPEVGDEERRGHCITRDSRYLQRRQHQVRDREGDEQRQDRGGQYSPGAARVELTERDLPGALDVADNQPRDQEAGDHEEHVDPDVSAAQTRHSGVVRDDRNDGYRPQTLDVRAEPSRAATLLSRRRAAGMAWRRR